MKPGAPHLIAALLELYAGDANALVIDILTASRSGPAPRMRVERVAVLSDADAIRKVLQSAGEPLPPGRIVEAVIALKPNAKPGSIRAKLNVLFKDGALARSRKGEGEYHYRLH